MGEQYEYVTIDIDLNQVHIDYRDEIVSRSFSFQQTSRDSSILKFNSQFQCKQRHGTNGIKKIIFWKLEIVTNQSSISFLGSFVWCVFAPFSFTSWNNSSHVLPEDRRRVENQSKLNIFTRSWHLGSLNWILVKTEMHFSSCFFRGKTQRVGQMTSMRLVDFWCYFLTTTSALWPIV